MGSKSGIAEWVISKLPPADVFVEPFAGGCAVTHAAILSGKYKRIIFNDITDSTQVFLDAIRGRFKDEDRWISREDFKRLKDTDPYVRLCFSFGNNQHTYAYGDIEPYKRAFHYAVVFQDLDPFKELGIPIPKSVVRSDNRKSRRLSVKRYLKWARGNSIGSLERSESLQSLERLESLQSLERLESLQSLERLESLQSLERLESLQSLERLERLESLERLERLENYQGDYRDIPIPTKESCVIYCDPPYRGTAGYLNKFDFGEFDDWCRAHKDNLFISEYNMPKDFRMISAIGKRSLLASKGCGKIKTEGLWVHEDVYDKYRSI